MREASVRRTKPPAGNPRCGSVPCGADRRARATKQAAAAAGPGPTPRGVWSRYAAARGLFCYVLMEPGGTRLKFSFPGSASLLRVPPGIEFRAAPRFAPAGGEGEPAAETPPDRALRQEIPSCSPTGEWNVDIHRAGRERP